MSKLYLVPTPVGNLEDITFRALEVLKKVDLILAEDTRTSSKLLRHFGIQTPTESYHMYNEHQKVENIIRKISLGADVAVITDAGTPGISDPGFLVAREAIKAGIDVECLPGATAFVPALVASGLPSDRFVFEGFLPVKKGRQTRLKELSAEKRTIVLYESPHKLLKTLADIASVFGKDRQVSVCRELSKIYEEYVRGTSQEVEAHFHQHPPKGEIVIVVGGCDRSRDE